MNYPSDSKTELDKLHIIKIILYEQYISDTMKLDMIKEVLK